MIGNKKEKEAKEGENAESKKGEEEPLADQYKTAYKKAKAVAWKWWKESWQKCWAMTK